MTIQGSSSVDLLESVLGAQSTRTEMDVAVLDKAQEITRQQGDAMVRLLERAAPEVQNGRLDTYA